MAGNAMPIAPNIEEIGVLETGICKGTAPFFCLVEKTLSG
jgi:hypothetical protein